MVLSVEDIGKSREIERLSYMLKTSRLFFASAALFAVAMSIHAQEEFDLTLLHTNDTHAAHAPNGNGDGGVARQAAVQKQIIAEGGNVLLVDAGDRFTGTLFHTLYLGADQVQIMNELGYAAMTLGNHEFDNGEEVLQSFVDGVNFPVLSANLDLSAYPTLAEKILPYTVTEIGGRQVGIIGLVTADTPDTSSPSDDIIFNSDYVGVANAAAAELTAQGVNVIVLLTHTGVEVDNAMVAGLENIDVVVGGHSHTLFSNLSKSAGNYPLAIETASGATVYYVQAGSGNQYLGRLNLSFDADGIVTRASGDAIFLSRYITPDADVEAIIAELNGPVEELKAQPIGAFSDINLAGDRRVCRIEECDLGNLIADSMRAETGAQIALMNGGGVRTDIAAGEITLGEMLELQPFGNLIATFEISGADLRAALENGASRLALNEAGQVERDGGSGRFLQVSGMRYTIDPTQEAGSRIVSAEVLQADGTYAPLDDAATYSVATNNFVRTGGDGFSMFNENAINPYDYGRVDYEVTSEYIASLGTITASLVDPENPRISFVNAEVEPLD